MGGHTAAVPGAFLRRMYDGEQFDLARLVAAKATTVSVCLPARDEASTIGPIIDAVRTELVSTGLVDEIVVLDDGSTDATASVAAAAGARVVSTAEVLADAGPPGGKGDALWKSVHVAHGDVIVWCDADVTNFDARFVVGLLGPLLTHPEIAFVKAFYERPLGDGEPGGRVTELVARPLVSLLHPQLASIVQPLAGEYAGRRTLLEALPFVQGYGVDLGLLIDVVASCGIEAVAQVDLGVRTHRNRPLRDLSPMALAVMQTAMARAGLPIERAATLVRPGVEAVEVAHVERPPLVTVPAYRRSRRRARPA